MSISLLWNQNKKGLHVSHRGSRLPDEPQNTTKPPEALNQLGSLKTHLHLEGKELVPNKETQRRGEWWSWRSGRHGRRGPLCRGWWVVLVILTVLTILTPGVLTAPWVILLQHRKHTVTVKTNHSDCRYHWYLLLVGSGDYSSFM